MQAAVIETLCQRAALFGATRIASLLEAETAHLDLDSGRNFATLTAAWGRLLSLEWRACGRSMGSLLGEISEAPWRAAASGSNASSGAHLAHHD